MAVIYGTPLFIGSGGGQNLTLPPMVTNLAASTGDQTITLTWTNPVSDVLSGVLVVYNADHIPEKVSDGTKVDAGLAETVDLTGLTNETLYYIRVFPYNAKKQYQTLIDGATATARPSEGPQQVTNLQVSGSGASPVLTWKNPTDDPTYHETVVIQKVDSAPTSLSDGTEIYRGTGETVSANGLERLKNYYWGVFTVNAEGGTRGPVISDVYSYDFPAEPTFWTEIETLSDSESWVAPENGWFKFVCAAKCGNGGTSMVAWDGGLPGAQPPHEYWGLSGGAGGAGGYSESKVSKLKDEIVEITFSNGSISCLDISVTAGGDGVGGFTSNRPGGAGGTASGGNLVNTDGTAGASGVVGNHYTGSSSSISMAATQGGLRGDGQRGGNGAGITNGNENSPAAGVGAAAHVKIYRGNTNVPAPSQASTLSLTPRNASIEASWTNSEDPESVGTILVSNSDHIPTNPTDGTSVDVAGATTYTISDLPNDTPTYVSLFADNADKTKYSAAKSDVEIPREVTWYDVQEDLKEDIADAQEDAEQAQEVVLLTRDFLPDAIALTLPEIYDEWNPDGISYIGKDTATQDKPASIVRRNGSLYRCLQSHTSQESWTPENSPSLWVLIDDPVIVWPEWKQPTGAHDAYDLNAKVSHNGKKWISQIAANTTEPGADERYWKEYTE